MPALRIGVDLASLELPLKDGLHTAARLGVDAVEIDARGLARPRDFPQTAIRQLRRLLEDLSLRVSAVSYRTRRGLVTAEELERRVDGTRSAMQFAQQLGAGVVVGSLGPLPPPDSEDWAMLLGVLDDLGRHAHRVGALLAAETGTDSGESLARLLGSLPEGTLGIDFNPGSLIVAGHAPREAAPLLGPWILHVHATDAIGGLSPGQGVRVSLGQGAVDFPSLLGVLEEFRYRGYFTVRSEGTGEPVRQSAAAVQYLRSL